MAIMSFKEFMLSEANRPAPRGDWTIMKAVSVYKTSNIPTLIKDPDVYGITIITGKINDKDVAILGAQGDYLKQKSKYSHNDDYICVQDTGNGYRSQTLRFKPDVQLHIGKDGTISGDYDKTTKYQYWVFK